MKNLISKGTVKLENFLAEEWLEFANFAKENYGEYAKECYAEYSAYSDLHATRARLIKERLVKQNEN